MSGELRAGLVVGCAWLVALVSHLAVGARPALAQWVGPEFQVNSYTTGEQSYPAIAANAAGDFTVVWRSSIQGEAGPGIFGQRFSSDGSPVDGEFAVHSSSQEDMSGPAVAVSPAGGFLVAWTALPAQTAGTSIRARRFESSGSAAGSEFVVNGSTTGQPMGAAVTVDGLGRYLVVWQDDDIFARRYDASGLPLGGDFQVNSTVFDSQSGPSIAADGGGGFVVVWASFGQDGSDYGIFGQRFDPAGIATGSEFQVNTYTTSWQVTPAVAMTVSGEFVVAWNRDHPGSGGSDIVLQRFDSSATPVGVEVQASGVSAGFKGRPTVALDSSGGFVVAWDAPGVDGSGSAVVAQRFASSGTKLGGEFQVNTFTSDFQGAVRAAAGPAASFVMTWYSSPGQDGADAGVFAQRIAPVPFRDDFESGGTCAWTQRFGSAEFCP